jgi:hypothetical protein
VDRVDDAELFAGSDAAASSSFTFGHEIPQAAARSTERSEQATGGPN